MVRIELLAQVVNRGSDGRQFDSVGTADRAEHVQFNEIHERKEGACGVSDFNKRVEFRIARLGRILSADSPRTNRSTRQTEVVRDVRDGIDRDVSWSFISVYVDDFVASQGDTPARKSLIADARRW